MCGRYALGLTRREVRERFGFEEFDERSLPPSLPLFNVAPSQAIPVVVETDQGRKLRIMRWGFKPAWTAGDGKRPAPINARAETLLERPLFRSSIGRHRCILPATGFYEWQAAAGRKSKQPWHFKLETGGPFGFAGLWTPGPDGEDTAVIITTEANQLVAPIHDRMPVILAPEDEALWLDREETDPLAVLGSLRPYPEHLMTGYPVSPAVNRVGTDGPELVRPVGASTS